MTAERPPTPLELRAVAANLLLVESTEVLAVAGMRLGVDGVQNLVALAFTGRVNRTDEQRRYDVALSPTDALELVSMILTTLDAAARRG